MSSVANAASASSVVPWNAFFSHSLAFVVGILSVLVTKFVPGTLTQWRSEWQSDRTEAMEWYENVAADAQTVVVAIRESPDDERLDPAITDLDERLNTLPMPIETEVEEVAQTLVNVYDDFEGESPRLRQQLSAKAIELRRLATDNATEKRKRATIGRRLLKRLRS